MHLNVYRKFYNLSLYKVNINTGSLTFEFIEFSCTYIIIVTFSFDATVV